MVWNNLGTVYGILNRHDDAIDAFRQAARINPESVEAWYNLGVSYYLSGNRTAAMDAVKQLNRLDREKADRLFDAIVAP